ncbi:cyclic AMP-dependent transcription factor ATF-3-like [Brevipalpus obovatus]|uniref:cyclic AMP-dependent transcription factor ATF-3-like n=1 Tax=Brevipalpus obovatus TaxID=246614 RepID=UPI003D9EF4A8
MYDFPETESESMVIQAQVKDEFRVTSVVDQKHNLIKATLNFAIRNRRKIMGLSDIQVDTKIVDKESTIQDNENHEEPDERRLNRRERNRIAARKCRKNRKIKYNSLIKEFDNLDMANRALKSEIDGLLGEKQTLETNLRNHEPCLYDNVLLLKDCDSFDPTQHIMSYFSEINGFDMNE